MLAARERSRWLLEDRDVERHLGLAYDYTMEMLEAADPAGARARLLDPSGSEPLRRAKLWRRRALLGGGLLAPDRLLDEAESRFGLPSLELGYWAESVVERPWQLRPAAAATEPDGEWERVGSLYVPREVGEGEHDQDENQSGS